MPVKEDNKFFDIDSFLREFRSQVYKRKRRIQEQIISRNLDIFADNRTKLMVKRNSDANNHQIDMKKLIDHSIDRPYVEGGISPLSPYNTDLIFFSDDTSSSSTIYFEWSCNECPLYLPKICTCQKKNENDQNLYCNNDNCLGLFKIPYSLIQVSLNRINDSINSFVSNNKSLPNSLLIYYGKLKNSLILVISDIEQEKNVIKCLYPKSKTIGCISIYEITIDEKIRNTRRPYSTKLKYSGYIHDFDSISQSKKY